MLRKLISVCFACLLVFPAVVFALSRSGSIELGAWEQAHNYFVKKEADDGPCTKADGSRFTIGYVDIDPYPVTGEGLYRFIEQLTADGWIEHTGELPFDPENTDAKQLINYLAHRDLGDYIQFSSDINYYISEQYDGVEYVKKDLSRHIEKGEVDVLLCLGTQPADLLIHQMGITNVPIVVSAAVDPVASGLVSSEKYSGRPNVWVHTNTGIYTNQMRFYYNSHPFTKLGMVFYDESVAAFGPYSEAAEELGFAIDAKRIHTQDRADYYEMLADLYEQLVEEGIDAFLLNSDIIKEESKIAPLLEIFYRRNIPVFVQTGGYYVKDGALMLVENTDAQLAAEFLAGTMEKILQGQEPGSISQQFVIPPYLSLNLEAAERIGFLVSEDMLLSAEHIYASARLPEGSIYE